MSCADDTTTNVSIDDTDEDQMLILNGSERLRYFRDVSQLHRNHQQDPPSFLHRLLNRLRRY